MTQAAEYLMKMTELMNKSRPAAVSPEKREELEEKLTDIHNTVSGRPKIRANSKITSLNSQSLCVICHYSAVSILPDDVLNGACHLFVCCKIPGRLQQVDCCVRDHKYKRFGRDYSLPLL